MAAATDPRPEAAGVPDVSVVIPVYNTMPYLTACLQSMVEQSLGRDRMEVIAVDDGSTDGSGEELDRFAAEHPDLFHVLHQENSGGPAMPCNRGLDLARGRYVFFIGADDYLAVEALEKLVAAADEWESDVIWGRIEGVGGRGVSQLLFGRTEKDIPFPHSKLPFALANSKMFRRSLLEEHGIRYGLDLRVGSDQPFTVEAMLHARRISVLADQTYYYGVRRENAGNITFSSGWKARLEDIGTVMRHVAELVPAGEDRDQILHRHFAWEVNNRLRPFVLELPAEEQKELCAVVARMCDAYLTDRITDRLPVSARVRILLAREGRLDELRAVLEAERDERPAPVLVRDGRVLLAVPGYDAMPEDWLASRAENLLKRLDDGIRVTGLSWQGAVLHVEVATNLHPESGTATRLELRPLPGKRHVAAPQRRTPAAQKRFRPVLRSKVGLAPGRQDDGGIDGGSALTARLNLTRLLERAPGQRRRWALRLVVRADDRVMDLPLNAGEAIPHDTVTLVRGDGRWYRLVGRVGPEGRLLVVREPVAASDVPRRRRVRARLGDLRRRLSRER